MLLTAGRAAAAAAVAVVAVVVAAVLSVVYFQTVAMAVSGTCPAAPA